MVGQVSIYATPGDSWISLSVPVYSRVQLFRLRRAAFHHTLAGDSLPFDEVEYRAKPFSSTRVDHFHEADSTFQVQAKIGMSMAILALGTQPNAVGECGFEPIEVGSHNVHVLIGDKTDEMLADALSHDARFAIVHREALFDQDGGNVCREPFYAPCECFAARKCEIVRITRVFRSD